MHYAILIILIIIILICQVICYLNVRRQTEKFMRIFPEDMNDYSINIIVPDSSVNTETDEDGCSKIQQNSDEGISQIEVKSPSPVMKEILTALNRYLRKNHGAASDFHLMKDVVERYCDAEEDEISTQQPIPLYLGLMGTMIGIIVGIGAISFTGNFSDDLMKNIGELMTCVAVAMIASFFGVLCTTLIAWQSKSAVSKVESDKNRFYSWIQTELLPVLSGDAVNALYLMQQNLMTFNQTFKSNILNLDEVLQKIGDTSKEQAALIDLVKDIDVKQVAVANIKVLKELKDCTSEIQVFNQYLHSVSSYLNAVNALNTSLNTHLDRTAAIERMGNFFESEIAQVSAREQYINQVVANVDDTLKKTFDSLSESTRLNVVELKAQSTAEFDEMHKLLQEQMIVFKDTLCRQQQDMTEILHHKNDELSAYMEEQKKTLSGKNTESDRIERLLPAIDEVKKILRHIDEKMDAVSAVPEGGVHVSGNMKLPKFALAASVFLGLSTLVTCFLCVRCMIEMWII